MGLMGLMRLMRGPSPIGPMRVSGQRVELPRVLELRQRVEDDSLRHADEVEKETGPEIEHAAPGVANFPVADGGQETGADVVIDLIF
jgi:hypothetical protein